MAADEELIRLRDLPGVGGINDLCRNKRNFDYPTSSYTQEKINEVSIRLFGITRHWTTWDAEHDRLYNAYLDQFEDDDSDAPDEVDGDDEDHDDDETEFVDSSAEKLAWEEKFHVTTLSLPESEPFWRAIGWDISDGAGKELLCAYLFDRQIIAAVGSLVPGAKLMLDGSGLADVDAERTDADLADRLDREAQEFMARRRR